MPEYYEKKEDGTYVPVDNMVPISRFNAVNTELGATKTKLEAMTSQMEGLTTAKTAAEQKAAEFEASLAAKAASHAEDLMLARHGIHDDLSMRAARVALEGVAADQRAATLDAWKADPTAAPVFMRPYFEQPAQSTTTQQTTQSTDQQTTRAQPATNTGDTGNGNTGAGSSFTREQISRMSPEEFKANRDAIYRDIRENPA